MTTPQPTGPIDSDRLLSVEEVIALLPLQNGKPFSRKFVMRKVAPESKVRLGRAVYWRKCDVEAWLLAQVRRQLGARPSDRWPPPPPAARR